jgi:hypothetical protein
MMVLAFMDTAVVVVKDGKRRRRLEIMLRNMLDNL